MIEWAPAASPRARSTFVTVVAWVFIVLAGFATLIALMQAMMFAFLFPPGELSSAAGAARELHGMRPAFRFLVQNVWVVVAAFWTAAILTLVASIGLLRRKNWARVMFIALMALGIALNLGGLWLQRQIVASMPRRPDLPAEAASALERMASIMGIGMAALAVVIAMLLGWIAVRLMSHVVKAEFKGR